MELGVCTGCEGHTHAPQVPHARIILLHLQNSKAYNNIKNILIPSNSADTRLPCPQNRPSRATVLDLTTVNTLKGGYRHKEAGLRRGVLLSKNWRTLPGFRHIPSPMTSHIGDLLGLTILLSDLDLQNRGHGHRVVGCRCSCRRGWHCTHGPFQSKGYGSGCTRLRPAQRRNNRNWSPSEITKQR